MVSKKVNDHLNKDFTTILNKILNLRHFTNYQLIMKILITGGTGFIGQTLVLFLQQKKHHVMVLTRKPDKVSNPTISVVASLAEINKADNINAIINLAGAPIAKRWTKTYKQTLIDSRIGTTEKIIKLITRLRYKPKVLISASAIGYYGAQGANPLDETAKPHPEFTHTLCAEWERYALRAQNEGVRVCVVRLGAVLGKSGGALKRILPSFRLGLGGKMGDGRQIFSWVHIDDVVRAFDFLLNKDELSGPFNLTAPHAVSNEKFTKALAYALHRPSCLPIPRLVIKMLFGEMGDSLLIKGQNVIPRRLQQAGFRFDYSTLSKALQSILKEIRR